MNTNFLDDNTHQFTRYARTQGLHKLLEEVEFRVLTTLARELRSIQAMALTFDMPHGTLRNRLTKYGIKIKDVSQKGSRAPYFSRPRSGTPKEDYAKRALEVLK